MTAFRRSETASKQRWNYLFKDHYAERQALQKPSGCKSGSTHWRRASSVCSRSRV
jgi:hypothetical protein